MLVRLQIRAAAPESVPQKALDDLLDAATKAEAAGEIVAEPELQEVTNKLLTALGAEDLDVAEKLRRKFIALAQEDVANVSE